MNRQQLRKWPTRRRQRALTVTVEESGEPLDIGAFCERYARVLISEMQETLADDHGSSVTTLDSPRQWK